jgi:hypothetical protein
MIIWSFFNDVCDLGKARALFWSQAHVNLFLIDVFLICCGPQVLVLSRGNGGQQLTGIDMMCLQGWDAEFLIEALSKKVVTEATLRDLAGNAFSAPIIGAFFLAILASISKQTAKKFKESIDIEWHDDDDTMSFIRSMS